MLSKILRLKDLARIPSFSGEQFIHVMLNLDLESGTINFGFKHKIEMGEMQFKSLEEAIEEVIVLRKKARMCSRCQ